MKELNQQLRASALVMRVMGWGVILVGPIVTFAYPPGFFWGELPPDFPLLGPPHPPSHYAGRAPIPAS